MNKCVLLAISQSVKIPTCRFVSTRKQSTPAEYCLNLVRRNDHENFLCTLLLPNSIRSSAFAIRAFNVEVALVEDQVSEAHIGQMRLKFWEDTLNAIYSKSPPQNPTALELSRILKQKELPKRYFKRLIEARFNKLSSSVFPTLESLESYAEQTSSSIYYLLLEAHGTKDVHVDHFASHLGKAHGIVTMIRSVPHNAHRRKIVLPQDVLMKHKVSAESVFRGSNDKNVRDVIFEVSSRAKQHLDKAKSLQDRIKNKEVKVIFLPSTIIDIYLEKLRRVDFDVFHPSLQQRNNLLPLRLYWSKMFL